VQRGEAVHHHALLMCLGLQRKLRLGEREMMGEVRLCMRVRRGCGE
jgi:hypothetical protein